MTIEKDIAIKDNLHINRNVLKLLPLQNELGGCELQLESLSTVVLICMLLIIKSLFVEHVHWSACMQ